MMATSHALSGAVIGLTIAQPLAAIPLAFISHFVLDAFPHIGLDEYGGHLKKRRLFHWMLAVDTILLIVVFSWLFISGAPLVVFACMIAAGSPDLIWAYRYIVQEKGGKNSPHGKSLFSTFHSKIQWSQTLKGTYLEVPFAILCVYIIFRSL